VIGWKEKEGHSTAHEIKTVRNINECKPKQISIEDARFGDI
jgi:hypothetical protein